MFRFLFVGWLGSKNSDLLRRKQQNTHSALIEIPQNDYPIEKNNEIFLD